ncbi:MAG: S-layer homology domain-containing protein [Clostridia bacterium]|nr:S-layer homology domain-containing protein [Clostridia bacterium]
METGRQAAGFPDVRDGAWYADAVHWASEIGLVGGYGDGRVGPLDPITREELMAILDRYCRYCGVVLPQTGESTLQAFHDAPELSPYAVEAAQHMVGLGVVHGDRGQLSPHAGAERAQVAVMLQRLLNLLLVQG